MNFIEYINEAKLGNTTQTQYFNTRGDKIMNFREYINEAKSVHQMEAKWTELEKIAKKMEYDRWRTMAKQLEIDFEPFKIYIARENSGDLYLFADRTFVVTKGDRGDYAVVNEYGELMAYRPDVVKQMFLNLTT
jgi:hypothetical protein